MVWKGVVEVMLLPVLWAHNMCTALNHGIIPLYHLISPLMPLINKEL